MKQCVSERVVLRPLTKHEIDGRIDTLVQELAACSPTAGTESAEVGRPRWISASELVRRMHPFLVLN